MQLSVSTINRNTPDQSLLWRAVVSDLERSDPGEGQASKYALMVSDTYLIEDGEPLQLTNVAARNWSDAAYFFKVQLRACHGIMEVLLACAVVQGSSSDRRSVACGSEGPAHDAAFSQLRTCIITSTCEVFVRHASCWIPAQT